MLVGGVLQGRELIDVAERNAAISEMTALSVAINTFSLQYNGAFPGDFNEAQDYWGTTGVENGNSNGKIGGTPAEWSHATTSEFVQFWVHLEKSELYELEDDTLSPTRKKINNVDNISAVVGYKLPLSSHYWSSSPTFKMKNKHGLYMVNDNVVSGWTLGELSSTDFLHPIDKKIDDGLPGQGNILAKNGTNTPTGKNCVIDNGTDSNKYNLNSSTTSDTCTAMWYFE